MLIILTAVEKVAINFGKENEEWLEDLSVEKAKTYINRGTLRRRFHASEGAGRRRLASSGADRTALITHLNKARDGIMGKTGTRIHL